jgi:hypothetical protein
MDAAIAAMREDPELDKPALKEPMVRLREDAVAARGSTLALIETVMARHERVQHDKRKAAWVERSDASWTLMPGFGVEGLPNYEGTYLHPFRIVNAYSMLSDVGLIHGGPVDAEA